MRSRRTAHDQVTEVARRRLELLSAELAAIRPDPVDPPPPVVQDGSGEPIGSPRVPTAAPGRHARRSVGTATAAAGWLHDRLPTTLQGRVQLGASHLSVLAVLIAVALGVTAWWAVRANDPGELVPARALSGLTPTALVTPVASAGVPAGSAPGLGSSPGPPAPVGTASGAAGLSTGGTEAVGAQGEIVVDVAGRVRRPGIARLPFGSRVVDAVEAAGGARRGVDLRSLNLARVLVDGEQVLVGVAPVPGVAASAAAGPVLPSGGGSGAPAPLVNLNTADQVTLETLPGVGPVTATAILAWRTEHGSFTSVEELLDVSGIGDATLAEIAPFVTL